MIGLPEGIADPRLTLLNHAKRWIEVAPQAVDLMHGRCVGVPYAQIESQSLAGVEVILNEPGERVPSLLALCAAAEEKSSRRTSGEEVFEWTGCSFTVGERRAVLLALEIDP